MKIDTFIQLISELRKNQITDDDTDPSNILLQMYTSPYDNLSVGESVRVWTANPSTLTWGDGSYTTVLDAEGVSWDKPNCGWMYGSNGRWQ